MTGLLLLVTIIGAIDMARRTAILMLISIELMFNAVNLSLERVRFALA